MNLLQLPNAAYQIGHMVQGAIRFYFVRQASAEKKVVDQFDWTEKLLLAAMFPPMYVLPGLYLFTPFLSFADYDLPLILRWAGVPLMVLSLWLFWQSHADLGQNWSVSLELRENHQLVKHGIYGWIRHPMYASIWLWGLAQGMMLANWLAGWSMLPVFAVMFFIRLPREEEMMVAQFGDAYREYAKHTGSLLPYPFRAAELSPVRDDQQDSKREPTSP